MEICSVLAATHNTYMHAKDQHSPVMCRNLPVSRRPAASLAPGLRLGSALGGAALAATQKSSPHVSASRNCSMARGGGERGGLPQSNKAKKR